MASSSSFNYDTNDLDKRMSRRRRLPHPSRSNSNSNSSPNGNGDPLANPPLTYSNFLGNLIIDNPLSDAVPFNTPARSSNATRSNHTQSQAGPSRVGTHTHSRIPTAEFVVASEWTNGSFGLPLNANARELEMLEDDEILTTTNLEDDLGEISITSRAKRPALSALNATEHESRPFTFTTADIPFSSTPTPRRPARPRNIPSLSSASPQGTQHYTPNKTMTAGSVSMAPAGANPQTLPDGPLEVALVKETMALLTLCQSDVQFMNNYFLAQDPKYDLSDHADVCTRIEEAIKSLHQTLMQRIRVGAEEWDARSPSWHQKYARRLLALRTTLLRLSRLRALLENRTLRPNQREPVLAKLEQHEAKLADLVFKYSVAFDRLRLRHLHFLLTQSHNEAREQLQKQRLTSRASFERRWEEGKHFRAGLRNAFHELRQEYYDRPRPANGIPDVL